MVRTESGLSPVSTTAQGEGGGDEVEIQATHLEPKHVGTKAVQTKPVESALYRWRASS